MITKLMEKLGYIKKRDIEPIPEKRERPRSVFTTHLNQSEINQEELDRLWQLNFKDNIHPSIVMDSKEKSTFAMDAQLNTKSAYQNQLLPEQQVLWYANQTFIGYQLCAMLAQNWLIDKACLMPGKDAIRNGYEITINDGTEIDAEVLDEIRKQDVKYNINQNMIEFVKMGRVFGIRIAMFIIEVDNPDEFYRNPFNPDAITPGSYKGISQVDPYWITPQLSGEASGNPAAIDFYVPTWWVIDGRPVHRTHLIIFLNDEVPDILKPTYIFGGIPLPQKIANRVYAAERTANEAPMLAVTKRTDVLNLDSAQFETFADKAANTLANWVYNRDNYGVKTIGLDEKLTQFDTSLNDLDAVIMTQYQLVAAASNVPATKLLGTSPKGFNATGEFEESSYHEELESIQTHDLTPLLDRHHLCLIRSEIAPQFNMEPFHVTVNWKPTDAMTAKELAEVNRVKAETGQTLINSGAISGEEERDRIIADPDSGYTGLVAATEMEVMLNDPDDDIVELNNPVGG